MVNKKLKKIMLLEFKRTADCGESYFKDMWKVAENQHSPILTGLKTLAEERGWEVAVVPLIAGQRSVREKEWLEALRIFGIDKVDGLRIVSRLGRNLLDEHEKLFGSYWRLTFGPQVAYYSYWGRASRSGLGKVGTEDLRDSRETLRVGDKFFLCVSRAFSLYMTLLFLLSTLSLIYIYILIRLHSPPPAESVSTALG